MPGVRIVHPTLRNCVVLVPFLHRPLKAPTDCQGCGTKHLVKTYHLALDDQGAAIVSREIVAQFAKVGMGEFTVANEVESPPAQTVSSNGGPRDRPPIRELAPLAVERS